MKLSKTDRLVAWFQDRGIIVELRESQPLWPYVVWASIDRGNRHAAANHGFGRTLEAALTDLQANARAQAERDHEEDTRPDPETRAERGERMWEEQRDRDLDKGAA